MAKFIGCYKAKVDDKGRLIFPAAFKSCMGEGVPLRFVVKKSLFASCLELYAYDEWERDSEAVRSRLNFFNPEHAAFWREYMRGTADVEPDSKLGRMTIPKALLEKAGIGKDVVFAGNNHVIEIWDKDRYEAGEMGGEEFSALAQRILG